MNSSFITSGTVCVGFHCEMIRIFFCSKHKMFYLFRKPGQCFPKSIDGRYWSGMVISTNREFNMNGPDCPK